MHGSIAGLVGYEGGRKGGPKSMAYGAFFIPICPQGGYPVSSTSHNMLKSGFASNDETIGSSTGEGSLLK
jgi:hypothetical protein